MSATRRALRKVRGFLGKYVNREVLADRLQGMRKSFSTLSRGTVLELLSLALIVVIAVIVRMMPIRWGFYLNEFDPYLQWRMSQYIVDHGFLAWFKWHDTMSWYPYGADMPTWNLYGEAFVVAAVTMSLHSLGIAVSDFDVAMIFPVVAGTLTVLAAYVLGTDLWGRGVGMFTALFLALNPSSIGRTQLGFLRHEPLGILLLLLIFIFFRRAMNPATSTRRTLAYAGLAGFSLFYLSASWAAAYFPLDLLALYAVVLAIIGRSSRKLFISYSVAMGVFLLLTPFLVPKLGFATLDDVSWLVIPFGEIILLAREVSGYISNRKTQFYLLVGVVAVTIAGIAALSYLNLIANPYGKFYAVINPFVRGDVPIIASVAEHQPATWSSFFYEFGAILILGLFGFVFILQRARNDDIFLLLWSVTSVYFAASFVRLTLLLAPAFCILAAIGTVELGKPAIDIIREAVIFPKRKTRVIARIGREFGVAIFLILLILMVPSFWRAVQASYQPATIVTSSIPTAPSAGNELKYQDWLQALAWMKSNTAPGSVVFAWWDYGYWITALGDRRTLADNGTQNSTQIGVIAQTFLDNTTFAIPMLKQYNVSYVAIFITPGSQGSYQGFGEDGKWYWMARIGNNSLWSHGNQNYKIVFLVKTNSQAQSSTYYRVIENATSGKPISNDTITDNNEPNAQTMLGWMMSKGTLQSGAASSPFDGYLELAFTSTNKFVYLFQAAYPSPIHLNLGHINSRIGLGQKILFTGNLTDQDGNPITRGSTQVNLEYLAPSGQWVTIQAVQATADGGFNYTWTPTAPGNYTLRAHYVGVSGLYFEAGTEGQQVQVVPTSIGLTLSSSATQVTAGQKVTLQWAMNPFVKNANVTLSYSADNRTYTIIKTFVMVSPTMNYTWTVPVARTFTVMVRWGGNQSYESSSAVVIINPKP
jgi:dolichyl-diphosphooligosaccharide--protein glycosyltransferase